MSGGFRMAVAGGELMDSPAFMAQRNGRDGKQQRVIGESGLA
jgi:hypothetical protein